MVHQRQRLAFGLEAGDDLARIHAGLDDLQSHLAADGVLLFGDKDQSHAAFADLLHQLVGADDRAGTLGEGMRLSGGDERVSRKLSLSAVYVSWLGGHPRPAS